MSYQLAGKIAGLGRFRSLGDTTSDHAAWLQEKAAYDKTVAAYAAQSAGQQAGYSMAQAGYLRDLTAWNNEASARSAALVAIQKQQLQNQQAQDRGNAAARAAGVVTPAGYSGCVSQAQHNSWQAACNTVNTTVKGLGADPTGPLCALALLPVCASPIPYPPPLRPKPIPPTPPPALAPPRPLRPEPLPPATHPPVVATPAFAPTPASHPLPVLNTAPQPIPSSLPTPAPTPAAPTKSGGLLSNGLLLVVLGGTGYLLYRTFKKPKAAA